MAYLGSRKREGQSGGSKPTHPCYQGLVQWKKRKPIKNVSRGDHGLITPPKYATDDNRLFIKLENLKQDQHVDHTA